MKAEIKDILPDEGLGLIKFGMTPDELRAIIGAPNETEEFDEDDSLDIAWHYDEMGLSFTFTVVENSLYLETAAVSDDFYEFMGERLLGKTEAEVLKELHLLDVGECDISKGEGDGVGSVIIDDLGLIFWIDEGVVSEIQWGADM